MGLFYFLDLKCNSFLSYYTVSQLKQKKWKIKKKENQMINLQRFQPVVSKCTKDLTI